MRCPKCGYISFDHLDTCLKCNKEISKAADALKGTVFNVAAPNFLKVNIQPQEEYNSTADADFDDDIVMEAIDPDLDILLDDDGNAEDNLDEISALAGDDDTFTLSDEDDDDGIAIDFNQFEDAELDDSDASPEINMDMPEELADLSDLDQPSAPAAPSLDDDAQFDLDLGDFDTDLGELGGEEESPAPTPSPAEEETISFDDFDLSLEDDSQEEDAPAGVSPAAESPAVVSSNDDDDDLDISLDLGGLSLDK